MNAMTIKLEARIAVSGEPAELERFREHVRSLLVRDPEAEGYEDTLHGDRLEFRFALQRGIPFPAFADASAAFPALRIAAEWTNHAQSLSGRAIIEDGRLVEQSSVPLAPAEDAAFHVAAAPDARLTLAWVCVPRAGGWLGYAAHAEGHSFFLWKEGVLELLAQDDARVDAGLEDLALAFAAEWLWYDESPQAESAAERRRYAERGWTVRGANPRTERMARLPAGRPLPGTEGLGAVLENLWARRPGKD